MSFAVEIENLSVCFGDYQALEDISIQIPEGSFVAIIGPNGAGKSTLIKVLLGLIKPTKGHIRLYGKSPRQVPAEWFGYIPQVKTLDRTFPALAIELVISGLRRRWASRITNEERQKAITALEQVDAKHLVNRPLGRLSGGELQRVYLARTLIRHPRLIMLDEPATGIDAVGEADMYHLLEDYQTDHQATTLMITHDWEAAYHASLVLVLNRRKIGFGIPDKALSDECLRRAFGHTNHPHEMFWGMKPNV